MTKHTTEETTKPMTCPHCGSTDTWLLRGNEVEIKEIVVNTQ